MNNNLSRLKAALAYILVILLLLGGIFLAVRFIRFGVNLKPWEETSAAEETSGEPPGEAGGEKTEGEQKREPEEKGQKGKNGPS